MVHKMSENTGDAFVDLIKRNLHMQRTSVIFIGNQEVGIPIHNIEIIYDKDILKIIHDDILKAVIDVNAINAVITGGVI